MPAMSAIEAMVCRSAPWRSFASRVVLPWVLAGRELRGDLLELGSGSGAMAAALLRQASGVRLTASDIDPKMILRLEDRLSDFGSRATVRTVDVTSLPFGDDHFDGVVSFLMLHHVIDWQAALDEAARVLRPGGAITGYDLTDTPLARAVHRVDGSPHRLIGPAEMADGLSVAGFVQVEVDLGLRHHVMRFSAQVA